MKSEGLPCIQSKLLNSTNYYKVYFDIILPPKAPQRPPIASLPDFVSICVIYGFCRDEIRSALLWDFMRTYVA